MGEGPNRRGASRRWIVQEIENSLVRLNTDRIDLYQIHRWANRPYSRQRRGSTS